MANKWLAHVKKTMKHMKAHGTYKKGDGLKKVILEAKKSYKKGGADDDKALPEPAVPSAPAADVGTVAGRRKTRRGGKSKKTRRASRK
jgi:hypothetical protein